MFDADKFLQDAKIVTTVDELVHLATHSVVFHKSKTVKTSVGKLTLVWRYEESDGEPSHSWVAHNERLELVNTFKGKLPRSPFSFLTIQPDQFGTVQGQPVFVNFGVSTIGKESECIALTISLYVKPTPTPSPPVAGQTDGN